MKRPLAAFLCIILLLGIPIAYGGSSIIPIVPTAEPPLARDDSYSFSLSASRVAHGDRISPLLNYENRLWDVRISSLRYECDPHDIRMFDTSAFSVDVPKGTALDISLPVGVLLSTAARPLTGLYFRAEVQPLDNGVPIGESYGISGGSTLTILHNVMQDSKPYFLPLDASYHVLACVTCGFAVGSPEHHPFNTVIMREADCVQGAIIYTICDDCHFYTEEYSKPLGHLWSAWVHEPDTMSHIRTCSRAGCPIGYQMERCTFDAAATPPTCTEAGYTAYTCTACSNSFQVPGEAATGHRWGNWVHVEETENMEAQHTRVCANDESHVETASCTYNEGAVTAPTCTAAGYTAYTCTACGYSYQVAGDAATGHDFQPDPSRDAAPACTSPGLEAWTCSRCPEQDDKVIEALGHDLVNRDAKAATCTEIGWNAYETCNRDGCTYSTYEAITALGHDFSADYFVDVQATCISEGSKSQHCSRCEEKQNVTVIPVLGHDFIDYTSDNNATCILDGTKTAKCGRCEVTDTIPDIDSALGHSFIDYTSDNNATCTLDGTKTAKCERCEVTDTIPDTGSVLGHDFAADYTVNVQSTCTTEGSKSQHCSRCEEKQNVTVIPVLGHDFIRDTARDVAPACTKEGLEAFTCIRCSEHDDVPLAMLGHTEISDSAVPTTCTATGLTEGSHCSVCNAILVAQEIVPMAPHTEVIDHAIPATCTTSGLTTGKHCSVCSEILVAQESITALGHTWGDWVHAEGTENADARHTRVCANNENHVEMAGCEFEDVIVSPTSTVGSFTEHTCKVCGYAYVDELTAPISSETAEPPASPTEVPTPPLTPTPAPTPSPTSTPTPEPPSTPTISVEAAATLVSDTEEVAVPFTLTTSQKEDGASELVIRAEVPTPAPTPVPAEGIPGEESGTEIPPQENITVKWSLNQALISEVQTSGFSTVRASVKGISVVIPVQELSNFSGEAYVLSIEEVQEDTLSESARTAIEGISRQSEVFSVRIEGKSDDELVLVSFALPESADRDQYQIVEINAKDGTLSYPETSLVVTEGISCLEGYVLNGSICFLAMK